MLVEKGYAEYINPPPGYILKHPPSSAPSSSDGTAEGSPRTPTDVKGQSTQGVYGLVSCTLV